MVWSRHVPQWSGRATELRAWLIRHRVVLGLNPVDIGENSAARDRPALREKWDDAGVEVVVYTRCARVVPKGISKQRKGELPRGPSAAIGTTPAKAGR